MNIKINTIQFDADAKLIEFVEGKISKLETLYDEIIGAEAFLKFDKSQKKHTENKAVKIIIEIKGNDLFAEKEAKSFEEATDNAVDALKRQIKKYKEKLRS